MLTMDLFDVLETIGSGAFGKVYKIRRKSDAKILVWKEIDFGKMSEKEKSQLVAEVNILRELRNPFIVRYYDRIVDKPSTKLYLIMEYCQGGDLGQLIKQARKDKTYIEEDLIWKIFGQAIVAIKDCHRRTENGERKPIIHRDIKPANILLDNHCDIKIGDFGLAKELSSQSKLAQTNVGTPYYMAPEIINEKDYDERSDIWSLGCLLYELAALKPPFDATNPIALGIKINSGRFSPIPSKYSSSLFDVIKQMLITEVKKRPRIDDLEKIQSVQNSLRIAKNTLQEFNFQQAYSSRIRDIKIREDQCKIHEEKLVKRENEIKDKSIFLEKWESELKERENKLNNKNDIVALDNNKLIPSKGFQIYIDPVVNISNDQNSQEAVHGIQKAKEIFNNKNIGLKYNTVNTKLLKRQITHDANDKENSFFVNPSDQINGEKENNSPLKRQKTVLANNGLGKMTSLYSGKNKSDIQNTANVHLDLHTLLKHKAVSHVFNGIEGIKRPL